MSWHVFMDAGHQRNSQNRVGTLMTIARVERDDHYGTAALLRRFDRQLNKPNLAALWEASWGGHLGLAGKFAQSEFRPVGQFCGFAAG